jgi:hypothetical protein
MSKPQHTNYSALIEGGYELHKHASEMSRLEFVGEYIFGFVTYQSDKAELFASKAIEVCAAISDQKTFDYIKDDDNCTWYLIMCNMPFFTEKIDWGTSVRGAWWSEEITLDCYGLCDDGKQLSDVTFTREEWERFLCSIKQFCAGAPNAFWKEQA